MLCKQDLLWFSCALAALEVPDFSLCCAGNVVSQNAKAHIVGHVK